VTWALKNWAEQARNAGAEPSGADAKPAATLVVLRDSADGLETLLLKRSSKLAFHGGAWVFPGGRIDDDDWHEGDDILRAAARAAVREATEEAGIEVDVETLVHLSNWTTPAISPKRFATWFFAAPAHAEIAEAVADGVESDAVRWFRPAEALAARAAGEIELAPPQYVTLLWLGEYPTVDAAMGEALFNLDINSGAYSCARCHTEGWSYGSPEVPGQGAFGWNLTGGSTASHFPNEQDMINFVKAGSVLGQRYGKQSQGSGRMPGFGNLLTDTQIKAIIEYVRGL